MAYVYGLCHPQTGTTYYIGITIDLKKRYSLHLAQMKPGTISIVKGGLKPEMFVIEEFADYGDALIAEGFWIQQFIQWGFDLDNKPHNVKRSGVARTYPNKPIYVTLTPEVRLKIRALVGNQRIRKMFSKHTGIYNWELKIYLNPGYRTIPKTVRDRVVEFETVRKEAA